MDGALLAAHTELGRSKQDVLEACRSTPLAACMRQVSCSVRFILARALRCHALPELRGCRRQLLSSVRSRHATWRC